MMKSGVVARGIRAIRINRIARFLDLCFEAVETILGIPPISYGEKKIATPFVRMLANRESRVGILFID